MFKAVGKLYGSVLLLLAAGSAGWAQQYSISTAAGGAPPATPVAAASVSVGQPRRVAVDGAGNVYFSSLNSVFKIAGGTLTLVAGNSHAGFSGDGGAAVNAQLNGPQGIAVDSAGNIYIADSQNNRVRRVSPAGIITTFAGNGQPGAYSFLGDGGAATDANLHLPSGVAVDSAGNVYIADTSNNSIRKVTTDGTINRIAGDTYAGWQGDGGAATAAEFRGPEDVALDSSGNIYVADTGNGCIRKIGTDGNITTIVGNLSTTEGIPPTIGYSGDNNVATQAGLIEPFSVAVDNNGNIYIAESADSRIRKVDGKSNIVITIAGTGSTGFSGDNGQSYGAQLAIPTGVAVDTFPNLYIADSLNGRVRKIAGGNISTIAGNGVYSYSGDGGPAAKAQMNGPAAVAADAAGNFYVADAGNNAVRKVANGTITTLAGNGAAGFGGDGGKGASAQLNAPAGVAADKSGNVYIGDTQNHRVRKVAADGTISTFAGNGTGGFGGDNGPAASAQVNTPMGLALDASGNLYIADFGNNRVRKVAAASGTISTVAGNGIQGYSGDGQPAVNAQLNGPQALAFDASGNLYIADTNNYAVRMVTPSGVISTVAGNGVPGYSGDLGQATLAQVGTPKGVAVDKAGNLFLSDGATRIRKVVPGGVIVTVAGKTTRGYSGDGGLATNAALYAPSGLAADASGNVFVADTGNNAVRMLQATPGTAMSLGAVTNAASNLAGPISPGEVVVIYGSGLGPDQLVKTQLDANGLVSRSLAGASVLFNGTPAPMIYTSATQTAAVVPYAVSGSSAQVFVQYQGQVTPPVNVPVAQAAPALFTLDSSGKGQAAAVNQDASKAINDAGHPVKIGDYIALYVTGYGQTNPSGTDGLLGAAPLPQPVLTVKVTIGGKTAFTNYTGQAPQVVAGVMQVNAQIPAGITAGAAVPVTVQVGDFSTQSGVTIAVGN